MRGISSCSRCIVALLALALAALLQAAAPGPSSAPAAPARSRCLVVLEDMGNVGLRITDAQALAQTVLDGLRQRVGTDRASYGGLAASARAMKKMLAGTGTPTEVQDTQIAEYEACEKAARWRVRARFGIKARRHWVTLTCSTTGMPAKVIDKARFEGASFAEVREQTARAMVNFCLQISPAGQAASAPAR
ncbi:MAG: hypothetical protein JXR83_01970 [Deltaproteobacteria bacterium]|nr:hypothetical protein [Deltaproteobacteria bacterium]